MIGTRTISLELLPKIGDRDDYEARIVGPGNTDYRVKISLTRTILSIWGVDSKKAAEELLNVIFNIIGTASAPPEGGFWFDSYNSASTLQETGNKIRNIGVHHFTRGGYHDTFVRLIGEELLNEIDTLNEFFVENYGYEFFRSFEDSFEQSRAIDDLSSPARDHANFIYRICILSVIIDHFAVRLENELGDTPSLIAFRNWLTAQVGEEIALEQTNTFRMIKYLRKQYPIHEHFDIDGDGNRRIRDELVEAEAYFGITSDYERDWLNVYDRMKNAFDRLMEVLG